MKVRVKRVVTLRVRVMIQTTKTILTRRSQRRRSQPRRSQPRRRPPLQVRRPRRNLVASMARQLVSSTIFLLLNSTPHLSHAFIPIYPPLNVESKSKTVYSSKVEVNEKGKSVAKIENGKNQFKTNPNNLYFVILTYFIRHISCTKTYNHCFSYSYDWSH